ncbi:MAG: 30S ribosomal protein S24e [Thermoplasmata archaeon]|nr:30S ribosomal protein S24e [Thermoplasmata archaeon]
MELKILEERPNPLLQRIEYRFEVSHAASATPKRDEVRGELAKLIKLPKDRLVIERMRAKFGTATTVGWAAGYQSADALKRIVADHIQVRNGLKEKAAKGPAAPAAEAPAAPPTPKKEG